ncbi:MAG: hypothetical protein IID37_04910 [Planctomycetes bacterium]|nr:hypothetical protein [Planctomycetota bacterium]
MRYTMGPLGVILSAVALPGCDVIDALGPTKVTVALVNDGDFPVEVRIFIDDDQNVLETLIDDVGVQREFTLAAGESIQFDEDCDDLQAIIIDEADLQLGGIDVGPNANTKVYRDGSDFGCGDVLTFTFSHAPVPIDLDIGFAVQPG